MATDVTATIRTKLDGDGFDNVASGSVWPDKATSASAILVVMEPSPRPEGQFGAGAEWKLPHFTVKCRDEREGDARATALLVYDALRYHKPVGWQYIRPIFSNPIGPFRDGNDLPIFEVSFEARIDE